MNFVPYALVYANEKVKLSPQILICSVNNNGRNQLKCITPYGKETGTPKFAMRNITLGYNDNPANSGAGVEPYNMPWEIPQEQIDLNVEADFAHNPGY